MDVTFLLADTDPVRRGCFQAGIRGLSSLRDFSYRMFTVSQPRAWEKLDSGQWSTVCIGLICADYPDAALLGQKLYQGNPFCRLIYYARGVRDVAGLLPSRPVRYLDTAPGEDAIRRCLQEEYLAWLTQAHCFRYEDRYQSICVPYAAISFFFSRDRLVYFQNGGQEAGPLRRTLDQIEKTLQPGCFLRCHKSFLVRRDACVLLDKNTRELELADGQRVPVSRAYWSAVAERFLSKC